MNEDGVLYAAVNAVDNVLTTVWLILTLLLPPILQKIFPRKRSIPPHLAGLSDEEIRERMTQNTNTVSLTDIAILLALGFGTLFLSTKIAALIPGLPSIIVLTTLALGFAQIPFVQKLQGGRILGYLLIMLFLAVIGAYCDINALINSGNVAGIL